MKSFNSSVLFILCLVYIIPERSYSTDQDLATTLKNELKFESNRRNDFKKHMADKKVYDRERDKGLALQLEEQERWDVQREQGGKAEKKRRSLIKTLDEDTPEYKQDLKLKMAREAEMEVSRKKHIQTKKTISEEFLKTLKSSEETELDLYSQRPRFDRDKRRNNKWVMNGKGGGGSSSSGASSSGGGDFGGGASAPGSTFDYPPVPNQDYVPIDNFDEIPPPPPLNSFDGSGNPNDGFYDEGNPPGYPPPPPPDGWDF